MRATAPTFTAAMFAALMTLAAAPAAAQDRDDATPLLSASGRGSVSVVPDIAIVTMGVTTRAQTASGALAANSSDLAAVITTVQGAGVEERDIGTSGFSITPVYQRAPNGRIEETPPPIAGYAVTNQIRVVIRDIAESGDLLDRVVRAGANVLNGISFDVDDREAADDEALAAAVAEARRKAEIMAEAAGVRLVRIMSISGDGIGGTPLFEQAVAMRAGAVPVMPGERQITANATVTWEIAPAE